MKIKRLSAIFITMLISVMTFFAVSAADCSHELKTKEDNVVEATYAKAGSYDNVTYCNVCGEEISRTTVTTDKKTVNKVEGIVTEAVAPDVIKVAWNLVEDADGYIVYLFNPKTKVFEEAKTVNSFSIVSAGISDVYADSDNKFMVKAYVNENGQTILGPDSEIAVEYVRPATPENLTFNANTSEITIIWDKTAGATGYKLYKYNYSNEKYVELATTSSNKYTVTVATPGTGFRIKIKAYKNADGKTLWSDETEPINVSAAPLPVKDIKYTVSASGIKLTWPEDRLVHGYRIYQYNNKRKKWVTLTTTERVVYKGTASYSTEVIAGGTYDFRIKAYIKTGGKTIWSEPSETISVKAAPETVKKFSASSQKTTSLKLSWSKSKGADGYRVYIYDDVKKKWKKLITTSSLKYTVKNLEPGSMYEFKIKAYRKIDGKTVWGNFSDSIAVDTKLSAVSRFKASQSESTITLKWKKVKGAHGYKIYKYNSKTKKYEKIKTVKSGSSISYKISKNLKPGTTYKFRITAYTKIGPKTILSNTTDLTTATEPKKVSVKELEASSKKKMTVSWKSVAGASGYQVVYSTSNNFDKKSDVTLTGKKSTKATIKKLTSGKKYYVKVRAYKVVDGKKIYGSYSSVKTVKVK